MKQKHDLIMSFHAHLYAIPINLLTNITQKKTLKLRIFTINPNLFLVTWQ